MKYSIEVKNRLVLWDSALRDAQSALFHALIIEKIDTVTNKSYQVSPSISSNFDAFNSDFTSRINTATENGEISKGAANEIHSFLCAHATVQYMTIFNPGFGVPGTTASNDCLEIKRIRSAMKTKVIEYMKNDGVDTEVYDYVFGTLSDKRNQMIAHKDAAANSPLYKKNSKRLFCSYNCFCGL
jgi:hypothetical protein